MADSAIKYFFSGNGSDVRGVQFASALSTGKLAELVQARNFSQKFPEIHDKDTHPEVVQFIALVGQFHKKLSEVPVSKLLADGNAFASVVVANFNKLTPTEQSFFNEFINLKFASAGGFSGGLPPPSTIKGIELANYESVKDSDIYINFLKQDHDMQRFAYVLKQQNIQVQSAIGISGIKVPPTTTLDAVYLGALAGTILPVAPYIGDPSMGFGLDQLEFIKNALEKVKSGPEFPSDPNASSYSYLDFATSDIIEVKDGKFVRKLNGKDTPIELSKDNCYSTQVKGAQCTKFIADVIISDDPESLAKYLDNLKMDDSAFALTVGKEMEEISNINPTLAVKILRKFGFVERSIPSRGREIKKFESFGDWIRNLKTKGLTDATIKNIEKATKLKLYLEVLVNFVNTNPAILNSGITDANPESEVVDPNSYLGRLGIKMIPRIVSTDDAPDFDTHNALLRIADATNIAQRLMAVPARMPFPFPIARMPFMSGGAPASSATLKSIINGLVGDLARKGKKLRKEDQDKIYGYIDILDKLEKAIAKVTTQLSEFKDWIAIFPDGKNETIGINTIESSIEKFRTCVQQHSRLETGLLNVALKLSQS